MAPTLPGQLVETGWLQDTLEAPDLRVLDCTVFLRPVEGGVRLESGRAEFERAHIPGAGFADLMGELVDRDTPLPAMMPPAEQFAEVMSRYGVSDDSRVVLYDSELSMWAARIWWMLRAFGFTRAALLNGGWKKWSSEGRPVESGVPRAQPSGRFTARPQPALIADWREVQGALNDSSVCLINALSADDHSGRVKRRARPGHIPGSVNVPAGSLVNPETHAYLNPSELRSRFEKAGALEGERVITYCGGGIAACSDAFALTLLGVGNVAIYDGSLAEWSSRAELPLEVD
jgi:thiosulfate/3-mercaptopyruvate sulfurtransferase